MGEVLREGGRGDEVRRLQHNLNAALGQRHGAIVADGQFGPRTREAVVRFQREFRLRDADGIVGPETRRALATRVLVIEGTITRAVTLAPPAPSSAPAPGGRPAPPVGAPVTPPRSAQPRGATTRATSAEPPHPQIVVQAQPAGAFATPTLMLHSAGPPGPPAPWIYSGQFALGFVYQTANEGRHWEFGLAAQIAINSGRWLTDPRYTFQGQASVAYADPFSVGRFHTAVFSQFLFLRNFTPDSTALGLQFGGQVSVDIVKDRWNVFGQGAVGVFPTLHDSAGAAGQVVFGAQSTLGTTVQFELWEPKPSRGR